MGRKVSESVWKWYRSGILVLHAIGIAIFAKGFLLTRSELPYFSHRADASHSHCAAASNSSSSWPSASVDRVVIVVLDALRFDFVAPSSFFAEKKPWMDKLSVLQDAAVASASGRGRHSAKIFKSIADPPTTSLQRLKALTTGGLPTFIDIGNSFGAPAIVEDNLIRQLVENGKRVIMMGDDTWVQLFPNHFNASYPYPSFNVKDLHTVDNGCVEHLLPALYEDTWDVLIAHFLGVDHAGHIFGVDSAAMNGKLEQYNQILEKVIEILNSNSGRGGLHQDTLLLVMGDHGQTLNGDHGGGSDEEVETSIFSMMFNKPPSLLKFDGSSCRLFSDGEKLCISPVYQLDFAVTISSLLGVPFPFGSIGKINAELYALAASSRDDLHNHSQDLTEAYIFDYANALCVNSWQVKRYIDAYSSSSLIGFSFEDMSRLSELYTLAEQTWTLMPSQNETRDVKLAATTNKIDAFSTFLSAVVDLSRAKWTEFDTNQMAIGLGLMILSIIFSFIIIRKALISSFDPASVVELILALFMILLRACSFLSNSYILEEGKVASFLLATSGMMKLRTALIREKMIFEASVFLLINAFLRLSIEVGLTKQAATSMFLSPSSSWIFGIAQTHPLFTHAKHLTPFIALFFVAFLSVRFVIQLRASKFFVCTVAGSLISYIIIALYWFSPIDKIAIPRIVYAISLIQMTSSLSRAFFWKEPVYSKNMICVVTIWTPTVILLSGKQGAMLALSSLIGVYCITRLSSVYGDGSVFDPLAIAQWNLFSVCLFFASGHWCAFDGLRYGAAFIGFDEFNLFRQAVLLAIDTFGFSHILPIFALPMLTSRSSQSGKSLVLGFVAYGVCTTTAATFSMISVAIQRRHLMVWGLFAPKFVFDVVGLLFADVFIFLASFFYM